ncbi:MAG: ribosome assembly RNA-binding protein YhbY [Desulfobulbus sp.]|nr:ribosome assembly RNA-binding protein YhbY [Desulfobulbus sp.]
MPDKTIVSSELTSAQKKFLRSRAHHLDPVVYVGREGFTSTLRQALKAALKAHELIKVKIGQNCPLERKVAAQELINITGAHLVQSIGRIVTLYLANPDLPPEKQLRLGSPASDS